MKANKQRGREGERKCAGRKVYIHNASAFTVYSILFSLVSFFALPPPCSFLLNFYPNVANEYPSVAIYI